MHYGAALENDGLIRDVEDLMGMLLHDDSRQMLFAKNTVQCAQKLLDKGFTKVTVLDEGLRTWKAKGYVTHSGFEP